MKKEEQLINLCCLRLMDLIFVFEHDMLWFKRMGKREAEIWFRRLFVCELAGRAQKRKASVMLFLAGTRKYWPQVVKRREVEHLEKKLNLASKRKCGRILECYNRPPLQRSASMSSSAAAALHKWWMRSVLKPGRLWITSSLHGCRTSSVLNVIVGVLSDQQKRVALSVFPNVQESHAWLRWTRELKLKHANRQKWESASK